MAISDKIVNKYGDAQFLAGEVLANGTGLESKLVKLSANGDGTYDASPETTITSGRNYYVVIRTPEQNVIKSVDYPQTIADNDKVLAIQAGQMRATFPEGHGLAVNDSVEVSLTNIFTKLSSGTNVGVVRAVDGNVVTIDFDLRLF